ncbi:DUF4328 domain-containing protein [Novosphingobium sp. FSY-8]|uniref:DUF4328 domain-containing protein n=1 Tax=Novosphingobium ovatum TaxID=1908523 RepID=A0ABW9XAT3_9SPHN|nr:DUF4328 domain-containing protein [Novosphingobium ovatum]NBC35617.1 DUF4328 domain-containing protein [Novosphingobium ovatum]
MFSSQYLDGANSLRRMTTILRVGIAASLLYVALRLCAMIALFAMARGLIVVDAWHLGDDTRAKLLIAASIGMVLMFLAVAGTFLLFLVWVWRAHANLRLSGIAGLRYSPAWAALNYLVPVVNLIVPPRAMRELWNRSHGENEWLGDSDVPEVGAWWTCQVVGLLIDSFIVLVVVNNALSPIKMTAPPMATLLLMGFAVVLQAMALIYQWKLVGAIATAQETTTGISETFT